MSHHTQKEIIAKAQAMVAPKGQRLSGPGTRKKNPARYDANGKRGAE